MTIEPFDGGTAPHDFEQILHNLNTVVKQDAVLLMNAYQIIFNPEGGPLNLLTPVQRNYYQLTSHKW